METDNDIMNRVREGDLAQAGVLFERHKKRLFNFFLSGTNRRDASEDLVQDVFLRILKYRASFNGDDFVVWMYAIARNARNDYYSSRKTPFDSLDNHEHLPARDIGPDTTVENRDNISLLKRALGMLPGDMREIIRLSRYDNLRYKEIGEVLGCSEGAVKVRVFRAMKELTRIYSSLTGGESYEMR